MKITLRNMAVSACMVFTIWMIVCLIGAYIFIGPTGNINFVASILFASVAICALQAFWFYGPWIKTMRYIFRLLGFAAMLMPSLFACGWFGGWFPQQIEVIASFFIIFVILFAIILIPYGIYFKRKAGSYEKALKSYREKQK